MRNLILFVCASSFFLSCGNINDTSEGKALKKGDSLNNPSMQKSAYEGKTLFKKYCTDCHSPPIKENRPDLRSLLGQLPVDSINSIINYVSESKSSSRKGGNILTEFKTDSSMVKYNHSFKDSMTKEDVKKIVIYSWEASHQNR